MIVLEKNPTSSDSVVAQLGKIYLIFSVWQPREGRTGLHVTGEGEEWTYSAAFLGVLLALQPELTGGERGRGRRVPERTTNPSPDVTPTMRRRRPTLAETEQLTARKRYCLKAQNFSGNTYTVGTFSAPGGDMERRR